ncbi:MAG TPA: serine hydrolase domain-containing protein [Ilumatobacteraceae bacterium]|nr:serine hydrolase domain-containing protein [Ilumatobacteraceae bacterium]
MAPLLCGVAFVVSSCASPPAGSEGFATVPTSEPAAPPTTELLDIADRDPLPFPGYDVTRVTIAPLPGVDPIEEPEAPPLTGWAAFDAELAGAILGGGSDAMSVAIAIDGEVVHAAAFGARIPDAPDPVTTADRFRIASISKTITAITALQLVEDGLVGLDDAVGRIAAFEAGVPAPSPSAAGITIRQLLTHTTGFAQYESLFFRNQVGSCEEAAAVGLRASISAGGFRYSNMNSCVLGLVIEGITGRSYEEAVYEHLLTPLGISGMRLAPTYDPGPGEVEHRSVPGRNYMEVLGAAGAWVATPTDLVTIVDSLDHDTPGWKPLEPATVAMMTTSVTDPGAPDRGYGMGLILYGGGARGHTGTIESTHSMVFDRADNVTWAVTVSGENPSQTVRLAGMVERALTAGGFTTG